MPVTRCPRCRTLLEQQTEQFVCSSCSGVFIPAEQVQDELLNAAVSAVRDLDGPPTAAAPLLCPLCVVPMQPLTVGAFEVDRCGTCGGVWLDAGELLDSQPPGEAASVLGRYLLYSLSLPERAVRSVVGLAAGTAKEAAQLLVPQAFQSSKTYEIVVANSLRFLTEDIGGAKRADDGKEAPDDFLARKAVGNFVDLAGVATLHVSPLWILAIVSDVAYGTKSYVRELGDELKRQGLIDETSTIRHADDVLEALRQASGSAAGMFDTPPLSVDELKQTLEQTRAAVGSADFKSLIPEAELQQYWKEMRDISQRENVSMLSVSGAVTMHSLGKLQTVSQGALTSVRVAGGLFNRHVLGHYADALEQIQTRGFYQTVRECYTPYVDAVWSNFAADKQTWTEELASGRALGKAYRAVSGWLTSRGDDTAKETQQGE